MRKAKQYRVLPAVSKLLPQYGLKQMERYVSIAKNLKNKISAKNRKKSEIRIHPDMRHHFSEDNTIALKEYNDLIKRADKLGVVNDVKELLRNSTLEEVEGCLAEAFMIKRAYRLDRYHNKPGEKETSAKRSKKSHTENYIRNRAILEILVGEWVCQMSGESGDLHFAHIEGHKYKKGGVISLLCRSSIRPALEEALKCALVLDDINLSFDYPVAYEIKPVGWQTMDQFCKYAKYLGHDAEEFRQNVESFHQRVRDYLEQNPGF